MLPGVGKFGRRRTRTRDSSSPDVHRRRRWSRRCSARREHGLAAARVGVGRVDLGVDDLERARRLRRGSPPCRRSRSCSKSMKRGMSASSMFSSLVSSDRPGLVALLDAHAVDRIEPIVGDAEFAAGAPTRLRTARPSARSADAAPSQARRRSSPAAPAPAAQQRGSRAPVSHGKVLVAEVRIGQEAQHARASAARSARARRDLR